MGFYKVNLDRFEGPLDLLLHLIRKNDLNIYDIPVSLILEQYLGYLDMMEDLDIDVAGEFILMAAELSHIKSRMLVRANWPQTPDEVAEEGPDPRAELVARLLEYEKYRSAAEWLLRRPWLGREHFARKELKRPDYWESNEQILELNLSKLTRAFHKALSRNPERPWVHSVSGERLSVTERIYSILDILKTGQKRTALSELMNAGHSRTHLVVTFLALLEMAKLQMIALWQMSDEGEIYLESRAENLGKAGGLPKIFSEFESDTAPVIISGEEPPVM